MIYTRIPATRTRISVSVKRKMLRQFNVAVLNTKRERGARYPSLLKEYRSLSKARLSLFNALAACAGACAYSGGLSVAAPALVGTYLLACSSGAINQLQETYEDSQMARTRLVRPLVTGRITRTNAKLFSGLSVITGTGILLHFCGPCSALIGLATMALYNGLYTPLKKRTIYNTEMGSIVGALPPLIGASAALHHQSPDLEVYAILSQLSTDPAAWSLFVLLFFWQMPHFMVICFRNRSDYIAGGFKMLSKNDESGFFCARKAVAYSTGLVTLPFIFTFSGITTWMYAVDGTVLALPFWYYNWSWFTNEDRRRSTGPVFKFGLFFLPTTLLLLTLHSGRWSYEKGNAMRAHFVCLQDRGALTGSDNLIKSSAVVNVQSELPVKPDCPMDPTLSAGDCLTNQTPTITIPAAVV